MDEGRGTAGLSPLGSLFAIRVDDLVRERELEGAHSGVEDVVVVEHALLPQLLLQQNHQLRDIAHRQEHRGLVCAGIGQLKSVRVLKALAQGHEDLRGERTLDCNGERGVVLILGERGVEVDERECRLDACRR